MERPQAQAADADPRFRQGNVARPRTAVAGSFALQSRPVDTAHRGRCHLRRTRYNTPSPLVVSPMSRTELGDTDSRGHAGRGAALARAGPGSTDLSAGSQWLWQTPTAPQVLLRARTCAARHRNAVSYRDRNRLGSSPISGWQSRPCRRPAAGIPEPRVEPTPTAILTSLRVPATDSARQWPRCRVARVRWRRYGSTRSAVADSGWFHPCTAIPFWRESIIDV